MNKNTMVFVLGLIVLVLLGYIIYSNKNKEELRAVTSFGECVLAGYPVMESYPRRCQTLDGRTYTEEILPSITYKNTSAENIVIDLPYPGAVTGKEFKAIGKAKGFMFEASFPVEVLDKDGKRLFIGPAHATVEDWMVSTLVPFEIDIKIPETYIGPATIIFSKDNASGLPQHDGSASFPITIEY